MLLGSGVNALRLDGGTGETAPGHVALRAGRLSGPPSAALVSGKTQTADRIGRSRRRPGRRTGCYDPARTSATAYEGQKVPAAGPPLQVPSDSPGVFTHR